MPMPPQYQTAGYVSQPVPMPIQPQYQQTTGYVSQPVQPIIPPTYVPPI